RLDGAFDAQQTPLALRHRTRAQRQRKARQSHASLSHRHVEPPQSSLALMRLPAMSPRRLARLLAALLVPSLLSAQSAPWMRSGLIPDRRASLLLDAMTVDEKMQQLVGAPGVIPEIPTCYGGRHVPGIARLGIPTFRITNGPVGVGQNDCVPVTTPNLPRAAMMSTLSAKATA